MKQYPSLVKQEQKDLKKRGYDLSEEQVYQLLLKNNFIEKDGTPTRFALENGLVSEVYTYPNGLNQSEEPEDDDIDPDLMAVFSKMPKDAFIETTQGYAIKNEPLKKAIQEATEKNELSKDGIKKWNKVIQSMTDKGYWI